MGDGTDKLLPRGTRRSLHRARALLRACDSLSLVRMASFCCRTAYHLYHLHHYSNRGLIRRQDAPESLVHEPGCAPCRSMHPNFSCALLHGQNCVSLHRSLRVGPLRSRFPRATHSKMPTSFAPALRPTRSRRPLWKEFGTGTNIEHNCISMSVPRLRWQAQWFRASHLRADFPPSPLPKLPRSAPLQDSDSLELLPPPPVRLPLTATCPYSTAAPRAGRAGRRQRSRRFSSSRQPLEESTKTPFHLPPPVPRPY